MTAALGSVCTGYGGLEMALALAGWNVELSWLSELDADASKILDYHHPDVPNLGDFTATDWSRVAKVDVITGGIPCQEWSLAGQRKGSEGERDLWPVRKTGKDGAPRRGAVDMLREIRPRVFVMENVASLVNAEKGTAWATILTDLHDLGYNAGWVTIGACRVGACHHRHRVFLIASLGDVLPPEGLLFGVPLAAAAKWPTSGLMAGGQVWPLDIEVCGAPVQASNMLSTPTATAYGNNQSPSKGAAVRPPLSQVILGQMLPTPRASDAEKGGPNQRGSSGDVMLPAAVQPGRFGQYEQAVRRHEQVFGVPAPEPTEPGRQGKPRLSPAFPEWMMCLPPGWLTDLVGDPKKDTTRITRNAAIKAAGNGVNPMQGAAAILLLAPYMPYLMPATVQELGVAA
ncbi:DNA cytosine methyltransferase [Micromonospora tulbaghiae]|uniref:DNA cytosine methyltransferase n=1 Tax=Micromonospora tulbaghiae TaxID=479978 RepID=UPI0033A650B2